MFSNRTRYCGSLASREFRLMQGDRLEAEFIERPNRFLVRAQIAGIGIVEAFMPNPGRLGELLIPGASLIIENVVSANIARKTAFTVQGVLHDGNVVCLNTLRTNEIAKFQHTYGPCSVKRRAVANDSFPNQGRCPSYFS